MIKYDNLTKIMITALLLGFSIWFGGTIARGAIGYDLFNPEAQLVLKDSYSNELKMQNVFLYANLALYTGVGYVAAFLASIVIAVKLKSQMRKNGWLFMALLLFFVASPLHLYFIYMDYQLAMPVVQGGLRDFLAYPVQHYFFSRFTNIGLTTMSSLAFLANMTSAIFVVWKPLQSNK